MGCETDVCMSLADMVFQEMQKMTPYEFMQIFPVDKQYGGEKSGIKDYFSVIKTINSYGINRKIENPEQFLMEYMNSDTDKFIIGVLNCASRMYRGYTGHSMMMDGMESCGMEYTAYNSDFTRVTHYDGEETKVTMPNFERMV